ncbi:biotin transporter BioY [Occultella gossypii]|uniref:Biotin transporter n=1 Tax=Occultella gossypii TaxID=2800820 RepID=A0ABS7S8C2_9MICO|nr:biotin transporter BioY [Occultella gossypii]MBZ2195443.1 biotin transporter BioY [Occultella gossypii]
MTVLSPAVRRAPLVDHIVISRSLATDVVLVLAGVTLVALLARVEVPLWPVPISGQTLGVMLVGASLGARRATAALTSYLLLGLAGLPVFAGGTGGLLSVTKPSFGFIIGFIFAAAFIGWLAERRWDERPLLSIAGFFGASIIPFLVGVPYMGAVLASLGLAHDPRTLIELGVTPFIVGGVIKWVIAAATMPLAWRVVRAFDRAGKP